MQNLPIRELAGSLPWGERILLGAPTASGKSTQVPLWLAEQGRVLVVEPRRVACRSLARYVAGFHPEVGYAVRFEREGPVDPRIFYVTTGVALRLAAHGQLSDFRSILLDEFHERTLEQDLLLALLPRLAGQSGWVVMSATLELERLADFMQGEVLRCQARSHPVEVTYVGGTTLPCAENLGARVAQAVQQALAATRGNVLVFLPGAGEIQECRAALARMRNLEVLVLHGRLTTAEQDRAFAAEGQQRRVILSTNVAETSVTLPGITAVVDSGLVRIKIHRKGYSTLSTEAISQASAEQRKGRAGRTEPGICLRLWKAEGKLEANTDPEVRRLDLTDLAMNARLCGQDVKSLQFLDAPPEFALAAGLDCLGRWGLLECPDARRMEYPLPIELARLIPLAPPEVLADLVDMCALLQSRGSLFDSRAAAEATEQRAADFPGCRLVSCLDALRQGDPTRHGLQPEVLGQAREMAAQLRRMLGLGAAGAARPEVLAGFLARHWPERVFVKRPKREAFSNGSAEARVDKSEGLADEVRAAILLEIQPISQRGLQVHLKARWALPCSLATLRQVGAGTVELDRVSWRGGRVVGELTRCLAGVELAREEVELGGRHLRVGLCQLLSRGSLWGGAMRELAEDHRLARLGDSDPGPWEASLLRRLEELGVENPEDVELIGPRDLNTAGLDEAERRRLSAAFPALFSSGVAVYRVEYDTEERRVTLKWQSGTRNAAVPLGLLPRWNGWRVQLEERGRLTHLR